MSLKQKIRHTALGIKYPDEGLSEETMLLKSKRELIQTIQHLSQKNERQRGVIDYQREENRNLTNRLLEATKQEKGRIENAYDAEGTLLPLLEAMEDRPAKERVVRN